VCGIGLAVSALLILGIPQLGPPWVPLFAFLVLWALYMSIVNVGQTFYGFGWEMLLLEAGFTVAFLGSDQSPPPTAVLIVTAWLAFRLEFGAGMIKIRGGQEWRDLTALYYHHETQPIPNRFSWRFHHLPEGVHKLEVAGNHFAQLVVPFGLFCPQPVASIAGLVVIVTQLWLTASGNFAWLNLLTIALATTALDGRVLGAALPVHHGALGAGPWWFTASVVALTLVMAVLSVRPARNMVSKQQVMNAAYNRFFLGNTYGLFGRITRVRAEVVLEGADDERLGPDTVWKAYEFKAKPGAPARRPRQVAPYHLRLDWLMWFLPLSAAYGEGWFVTFLARLLEGDAPTLRLLRRNPFPDRPPTYVRARLFLYEFTTWSERRATGAWWRRGVVGEYMSPVRLRDAR
jgi:hypothetical protein